MAAKKTPAKASEPEQDTTPVPSIDEGLLADRQAALAAEPEVKVLPAGEPTIDPVLVEARKKALETPHRVIGSL